MYLQGMAKPPGGKTVGTRRAGPCKEGGQPAGPCNKEEDQSMQNPGHQHALTFPLFTRAPRPGLHSGFGILTGAVTPGSIPVEPGSNPGYRPWCRAGFRPGFASRLRHNRVSSAKRWPRRKGSCGAIARQGCF